MNDLELLDDYFNGLLELPQRRQIEHRIETEPDFGRQAAFYLSARQAARQQALLERHRRWQPLRQPKPALTRPFIWVTRVAAVLVVFAGLWWFLHDRAPTVQELTDASIAQTLARPQGVPMGTPDSTSLPAERLRRAGITAYQAGKPDSAIVYFHQLAQIRGLYSNPGAYFEALVRLKRNHPGDTAVAHRLLRRVVSERLDYDKEADALLRARR